jgi:hypothetical protein
MASRAPVEVDILAATMPISIQHPIAIGNCVANSFSVADGSGSHLAQVGRSNALLQLVF